MIQIHQVGKKHSKHHDNNNVSRSYWSKTKGFFIQGVWQLKATKLFHKPSLWLVLVLLGTELMGQGILPTQRKWLQTFTNTNDTIEVALPGNHLLGTSGQNWSDRQIMGAIEVGIDPGQHACYAEFLRFEIDLSVEWEEWDTASSTMIPYSENKRFVVSYDPLNQNVYTERAIFYIPNAYMLRAISSNISSVAVYDSTGATVPVSNWYDFPFDVYVETKINAERYLHFNPSIAPSCSLSYSTGGHEVLFHLNAPTNGEVYYDIEYCWLDDYDLTSSNLSTQLPVTALYADFTFNATRIRIPSSLSSYAIPNAFDRGWLVARIRGVGKDAVNWDMEFPGVWDIQPGYGQTIRLDSISSAQRLQVSLTDAHEPNKNWQLMVSFAEDGKNKQVVSYADGTSRVRQQVTVLSTENISLVGQTVYDHQGRPALTVLPAPSGGSELRYFPNFNKVQGDSALYSRTHFDLDALVSSACTPMPLGMDTSSGASAFYSGANSLNTIHRDYVPHASLYPFQLTQFTSDQTGRVKKQGGVGPLHQPGSGHETRYVYGKPLQEQLDLLFGTDVGYDRFYKKQMVIDPNGQVSVSYFDMAGRVIATALAGQNPAELMPLLSEDMQDTILKTEARQLTADLLNKSVLYPKGHNNVWTLNGQGLELYTPITVSSPQTYSFDYELIGLNYVDSCLNAVCMDCVYDVEISIKDDCGNEMINGGAFYGTLGGMPDSLCNATDSLNHSFTASLDIGVYTLYKRVKINEDALDTYALMYLENDTCLDNLADFFQMPDTTDCFITCQKCKDELDSIGSESIYIQNQLNNLITSGVAIADTSFYLQSFSQTYRDKVAACDALCGSETGDYCEAGYLAMLADMRPGGQYAQFTTASNGIHLIPDDSLASIFYDHNLLPYRHVSQISGLYTGNAPKPHWRNPKFYNGSQWVDLYFKENGDTAKVILTFDVFNQPVPALVSGAPIYQYPNGTYYTYPQYLKHLTDFINAYDPGYAKSLVVYHPEYLVYQWCVTNTYGTQSVNGVSMNTWSYDEYLRSIDRSTAHGLLGNTFEPQTEDPFFILHGAAPWLGSSSSTNGDQIQHSLANIQTNPAGNSGVSAWEYAYIAEELGGGFNYPSLAVLEPNLPAGCFEINCTTAVDKTLLLVADNHWERFAYAYISAKQNVLVASMLHSSEILGAATSCIGNQSGVNYSANAYSDSLSVCDPTRIVFFEAKQPRFPSAMHAFSSGMTNSPPGNAEMEELANQQYFIETGICPIARDLEIMLASLINKNQLFSTLSLYPGPHLTPLLYHALDTSGALLWNPVFSNSDRHLFWPSGPNAPFTISIDPDAPAWVNFSNIQSLWGVHDVDQTSATSYSFLAYGNFENPSTQQTWQGLIMGLTDLPLTGCDTNFQAICRLTEPARQVLDLLRVLNNQGLLYSPTATPLNHLAMSVMGPDLTSAIGVNGPFTWQYNASPSPSFLLSNTSTAQNISIKITGPDWSSLTLTQAHRFLYLSNSPELTPTASSSNKIQLHIQQPVDPYPLSSLSIPTHQVELELIVTYNASLSPPLSECGFLNPMRCSTQPHQNQKDIKTMFQKMVDMGVTLLPQDSVASCISSLDDGGGAHPDFSTISAIVDLKPNLDSSSNGLTSNHFLLIVQKNSGTIDTLFGAYCKPIAHCPPCDIQLPCIPVDTLNFDVYIPAILPGDSVTGLFQLKFDAACLSISPLTLFLNDTISTSALASRWADLIDSLTPYASAQANGPRLTLRLPKSMMSSNCTCEQNQTKLRLYHGEMFLSGVAAECCLPPPSSPTCLPQDSLWIRMKIDTSIVFASGDFILLSPFDQSVCMNLSMLPLPYTGQGSISFMDDYVQAWNDTLGFASMQRQNDSLFVQIPTSLLLPDCDCQSQQMVKFEKWDGATTYTPINLSSQNIDCCLPPPPLSADLQCQAAQLQLDSLYNAGKLLARSVYDIRFNLWQTICHDPSGISSACQDSLESIEIQYWDQLHVLDSTYQAQLTQLLDTCAGWGIPDSLVMGSPCKKQWNVSPPVPLVDNCVDNLLQIAWFNAEQAYALYRDSVLNAFRDAYTGHCMNVMENFTMQFEDQEYHFTLYYYDQAGNLVRTVPPRAVQRLDTSDLASVKYERDVQNTTIRPLHNNGSSNSNDLATTYQFNAQNQPIEQRSPDGGNTRFWYDELGRLVFSQNDKQLSGQRYSYTLFDALGRITQVGTIYNSTLLNQSIAGSQGSRQTWYNNGNNREEITQTDYDLPAFTATDPENRRNRVATMIYRDCESCPIETSTNYFYDIHGNVNKLVQYNRQMDLMAGSGQGTKTIYYYYDLISGNVKSVAYNPDGQDRFFHKYSYDADNRLIGAESWAGPGMPWSEIGWSNTPTASIKWRERSNPLEGLSLWPWEEDARYFYYSHGPMARVELGHLKVQGLDYIYTLHGWIKGVNPNNLDPVNDPGKDADSSSTTNANRYVGRDAMSYMLDYFGTDYQPIGGSIANNFRAAKNALGFGGNLLPLYNGNISAMSTTLRDIQTLAPLPQAAQYRYDQLNRITAMDVWQDLDLSTNAWDVSSPLSDYRTRYHYDPSGNLLRLQRNGDNPSHYAMDHFTYHYSASNNRLQYVSDTVTAANYANDIDDQLPGNYGYDAIGNLTRDDAEEINAITWSVYGKVKSVGRTNGSSRPSMNFHYDASGQRVMKEVIYGVIGSHIDSTVKYFYVRDALGNVMATYRHSNRTPGLYLEEQSLYGSGRLGTRNQSFRVDISYSAPANMFKGISYVTRGYKTYELSNHLGNVLATISDRRVAGTCTDSIVDFYDADILSINDYYPFGAPMEGRSQQTKKYRFSFNGKEDDKEVEGQQDYGMRIYDKRLARFKSVDPLTKDYPMLTPYQFASNTPIQAIDLDGLEAYFVHGTGFTSSSGYFAGNIEKTFGDYAGGKQFFDWSGINSRDARSAAAKSLTKLIRETYVAGQPIVIVGHSHGGNVGIEALNLLASEFQTDLAQGKIKEIPKITLVTLNTPVREDYQLVAHVTANVNHINVYNKFDIVQIAGGIDTEGSNPRIGFAGRTYSNATNISYSDQTEFNFKDINDCGNGNHCGQLQENAEQWIPKVASELDELD